MADIKQTLTHSSFYKITLFAIFLGILGGLVTAAFLAVLNALETFIWEIVPEMLHLTDSVASGIYIVVATLLGGLFVGLCIMHLGPYPKSMDEEFAEFRQTKIFDYKHIPHSMLASLAALGFGATLGPEAVLVSIIGGIGSWVSKKIKTSVANAEFLAYMGISSSLGGLFGSPLGSVVLPYEEVGFKRSRFWTLIPGVAAALAGWFIFRFISGGDYLDYTFPAYAFAWEDLLMMLPIVLVGILVGCGYLFIESGLLRFVKKHTFHPLALSLTGGLILGLLALYSGLILFSGHEGIQEIVDTYATLGVSTLVLLCIFKMLAIASLLVTGWKGGRFFPVMFAGTAAGLACVFFFPGVPVMIAVAAGMCTVLSVVLRNGLVAFLLLIFIFQPALYICLAICAAVGSLVGKGLSRKFQIKLTV